VAAELDTVASAATLSPIRFLLRSAVVWATRVATEFEGEESTYADLLADVCRTAGALRAIGVRAGDRVAVLLPNVPAMLRMHFAVPGLGAVLVPINTRLSTQEIRYILGHSGAAVVIADASARQTMQTAVAALADPPVVVYEGRGEPDWTASAAPVEIAPPSDEHALLSINYTSGTTGRPKGVVYSHRGAYLHTLGVIAEAELQVRSGYLWTLPMFHCNGWAFTWSVTAAGARHICLDGVDPAAIWATLAAGGVTHLCGAPTVLTMLAEAADRRGVPGRVRAFVGGSPPSPTLLKRLEAIGVDVVHLYGMTETYGPLAICSWQPAWDELTIERQSVLRARQGVGTVVSEPLRVVDEQLHDVAADGETVGEVVMRGNNIMLGYYRDPEATAQALRGGWLHSGDLGVMHPDGYIELRGRAKDVIITGGENVAAVEIEHALEAHPAVAEAAIVGIPDERWGETPVGAVVLRRDQTASPEELQEFLRGRIARFKVPRRIEFRDELPKTATGKIRKFMLRDELLEPAASDRETAT
jgi:fatty-acyl-CoA synthase